MRRWPGLAIALVAGAHGAAKTGVTTMDHYTVRAGDTLAMLQRTGLAGHGALAQVVRINHIRSPRRLRIGQVLRIPRDLLRDEGTWATVETFSGPVALSLHGQSLPTRTGVTIGEGARVQTGRNGFVTLRLRDASAVSLPSQSDVTIARLRRVLLTGAVEREFTLANGRAHMTVTPMTLPDSTFRVVTPLSVSAVRGTDFRVDYAAAGQTAVTAVEEGRVAVNALHTATQPSLAQPSLVSAGLGLAISPQGMGVPTKLLPPPVLEDVGRVQTAAQLDFRVTTTTAATAYRAQISRDAGALDVIAETRQASPDLAFASIPPGTWFLRLASIDSQGIEGAAESYAFDRYRNEVHGTMGQTTLRRHHIYQFKWSGVADGPVRYRFRLWREGQDTTPTVDEIGLHGNALDVRDLAPGKYHWQIASILLVGHRMIESRSPEQSFQIAQPR